MPDLFAAPPGAREELAPGAILLRGFALEREAAIIEALHAALAVAPFRHMVTPGGHTMSVAMSNCGALGWVSDRRGYRYDPSDPSSGRPWPPLPAVFLALAAEAATAAGYEDFTPNACLINRYEPGARLTLHQDKNEGDITAPIVSVSLGLPARFLFGGLKRSDRPLRKTLEHGDVCVWGGPSRLAYHGIDALRDGEHAVMGRLRINLTLRKVARASAP
jgi:alkylated DNA repair protein (DNA oxidative demethylase)